MRTGIVLLVTLMTGCGNLKYRPVIFVFDHEKLEITNGKDRVYCGDESIKGYYAVDGDDLNDIKTVLKHAKVPWHIKIVLERLKKRGLLPSVN